MPTARATLPIWRTSVRFRGREQGGEQPNERTGAFGSVRVRSCSDLFALFGVFAPPFVRLFGGVRKFFFVGSPSATLHRSASAIQTSLIALGLIAALTRLRRLDPATPRKYQSRHKCPKGILKICEQAPIFNLALCTYGVRPLLRSAQSQRSHPCSFVRSVRFQFSVFSFQFSVFLLQVFAEELPDFGGGVHILFSP